MTLLEAVRDQYVEYPYPPRDPQDEHRRLLHNLLSQVTAVNHLFWAGRRPIDAGFSVLDAGCGTGDATICIAEQLRESGARVVALDFSRASLAIARERAQVRGLTNIEFVEASIEDLPRLGLGSFDYIISSGVLHHLASPEVGLGALRQVLKPDGGLAIMVYGRYGRAAIYQLQALFRLIAPPSLPAEQRLRIVKRRLGRLREGHPGLLFADGWRREVEESGDAALHDLFLHAQDRAYTVPEIYEWLEGAGLRLVSFDFPVGYNPRTWDDRVEVEHLSEVERHSLAELLHGGMANHTLFAGPADRAPPAPPAADDDLAIPTWSYRDAEGSRALALEDGTGLTVRAGVYTLTVTMNGLTRALLQRVDGRTPVGSILDSTQAAFSAATARQVRAEWLRAFGQLNGVNYLVLNPA